jgi:copper resistance protein B
MSMAWRGGAIGRSAGIALALAFSLRALAQQTDTDSGDHVPPAPPAQPMPPMSDREMDRIMDMHDDPLLGMFKLDQFERAQGDGASATEWEAEAWIGHDFDKLWLRSEGERASGVTDARVEALWDHAFASFWDWQLGARHDFGSGPGRPLSAVDGLRGSLSAINGLRGTQAPAYRTRAPARRDWAAFGVQGLAPYWFEIEATAYLGDAGRTALRLRAEYELLLTQRLILQPEFEANIYGTRDPARGVTDGLSDADLGLRLRYEIRRELAPYIGVVWKRRFGDSDSVVRFGSATQFVAGLRVWF